MGGGFGQRGGRYYDLLGTGRKRRDSNRRILDKKNVRGKEPKKRSLPSAGLGTLRNGSQRNNTKRWGGGGEKQ